VRCFVRSLGILHRNWRKILISLKTPKMRAIPRGYNGYIHSPGCVEMAGGASY
jgi:hypothetical protein